MADFEFININTTAEKIEKMANLETTYTPEEGKIPMYSQMGTIRSGTPRNQEDCTNKKYVDKKTIVDQTYNAESENAQSGKAVAEAVENKQDKLTAGDGITIDENNVISATGGGGSGGITDYELLENKPQINGVELLGNKSLSELGIEIPTKTSELENDSGFIDDSAFESYYTKTEVDEKTVVDQTYDENSQNAQSGTAVAEALSKISGGGETWEVISDTTTEFDTPVSQIVINQDTNGNSFSLKKMRVFIDFTVAEAYTGRARANTDSATFMYIVTQSFSAGNVYGYLIESEVLPMVNNRCQIINRFNHSRMTENGNNFDFNYNTGAVDYAIRNQMMSTTTLGYKVSSISDFNFQLASDSKINKARILIFGVRA